MDLLSQELRQAMSGHGHGCACDACLSRYCGGEPGTDKTLLWRLVAAGAVFIAALALSSAVPWLSRLLGAAACLTAGYDVLLRTAARVVRDRRLDEYVLMCAATVTAMLLGRTSEAAEALLFLRAGELIRCRAAASARVAAAESVRGRAGARELIMSQRDGRSRTEDMLARFCRVYLPAVLCVCALIAVLLPLVRHTTVSEDLRRAAGFLLVTCPCSAVLSVPLAYAAGIGGAVRHGILFRGAPAVDAVAETGVVLLEKDGALGGDGLRVVSVKGEKDARVLLRIAAHASAYADDAWAKAIRAASQDPIYIELIQRFRQEENGVTVRVDGVDIVLGAADFVRSHGVEPEDDVTEELCVFLAIDGRYAGRIVFGGVVGEDVQHAVTMLSWEPGRSLMMLTEDTPAAAERFARSAGLERFYAQRGAAARAELTRGLREREDTRGAVMFVGSADTDAESLRAADVGVAMHGASSDAALREGDVVVMDDGLTRVVTAMECARQIRRVAAQNLILTLAVKLAALGLFMFGACPLWLAALADPGAALLTCLNALRARDRI